MRVISRPAMIGFATLFTLLPHHQPLNAQDGTEAVATRTPESAQRFLLENSPFESPLILNGTTISNALVKPWKLEIKSNPNPCITQFSFPSMYGLSKPFEDVIVDWGAISKVEIAISDSETRSEDGLLIHLPQYLVPHANGPATEYYQEKAKYLFIIAPRKNTRLKLAMEFLMDACQNSTDTGF